MSVVTVIGVPTVNPLAVASIILRRSFFEVAGSIYANKYFEFGKIYEKLKDSNSEKRRLSIVFSGEIATKTWYNKSMVADFYTLKNIVTNLFLKLNLSTKERTIEYDGFEKSIGLYLNRKRLALIGLISNELNKEFDTKSTDVGTRSSVPPIHINRTQNSFLFVFIGVCRVTAADLFSCILAFYTAELF